MATYTVTSSANIDIYGTKSGSDTYNINAGYLTVDQDYRYGLNGVLTSCFGNITLSDTLGGTILFDSTGIRLFPYISGAGNVPVGNTLITQGTATGKLIGAYPTLTARPQVAGTVISSSGYLKVKQWNGVPFGTGSLTGAPISCSTADVAGWMEIPAMEALTATVNRLNTFVVRGAWYNLGTTDGDRNTPYQIPTNGSVVNYFPGVWVEKTTGSLKTDDDYEFYPCAGTVAALSASIATDAMRGKVCWITSSTAQVRFGSNGLVSTGGYIPDAGLNVRIPNIFFVNVTPVSNNTGQNVLPNATLATRYDFTTTNAGVIDIDKCSMSWYPSFTQPFSVRISSSAFMTQLFVQEIASPINWYQVGVGQEAANGQLGLSMATCFAGGKMDKCTWTAASLGASGRYVTSLTDLSGFTVTNERCVTLANKLNSAAGVGTFTRVANSSWTNTLIGGGRILLTTCTDVSFISSSYYDAPSLNTLSVNPMYMFDLTTNCLRITMDNINFGGLVMNQPYNGLLNVGSAGCTDIKLRNIGTYENQLELGSPRIKDAPWTRVTTTATVTSPNHGLLPGNIIYVIISNDPSAIAVGLKTIVGIPTVNTFTFAATAASTAGGTLSYYGVMSAYVFALASSAAANTVKIQRVYTDHSRTNICITDNSSKNILIENTFGDPVDAPVSAQLNGTHRGLGATHALTGQTSCYGTHWIDNYIAHPTLSTSSMRWTRNVAIISASAVDHRLRTGIPITVISSSDIYAVNLGYKTINAVTENTFSFIGVNVSGSSGTISYQVHNGRIGLLMNESTSDTIDQYTIDSGSTAFTSVGGLFMPSVGDQITFTTPYYILGHRAFPISDVTIAGGLFPNYDITYAMDKGTGVFGDFHNLSYIRTGSSGVSGSLTFNVSGAAGVQIGDYISGSGIRCTSIVTNVSGNTITTNLPTYSVVSGSIRFNHIPTEEINPAVGVKLKIRIKTMVPNTTAITSLFTPTTSDADSRAYQYVLESNTALLKLTGLISGSEIRVFPSGSRNALASVEDSGTEFTYSYTWAGTDIPVDIVIHNVSYEYIRYSNTLLGTSGLTIPIQQRFDRNFSNV